MKKLRDRQNPVCVVYGACMHSIQGHWQMKRQTTKQGYSGLGTLIMMLKLEVAHTHVCDCYQSSSIAVSRVLISHQHRAVGCINPGKPDRENHYSSGDVTPVSKTNGFPAVRRPSGTRFPLFPIPFPFPFPLPFPSLPFPCPGLY